MPWLCVVLLFAVCNAIDNLEKKTIDTIFKGYHSLTRPSETVRINISLQVAQLVQLDGTNRVMKSSVWPTQKWKDPRLQWDHRMELSTNGAFLHELKVEHVDVWHGDIVLLNNIDGNYEVSYKSHVLIYKEGDMLWMPPSIFNSHCQVNSKYFPFDSQQCDLIFGSWTYDSTKVNLRCEDQEAKYKDANSFYESSEWKVISIPCKDGTAFIPGSKNNHTIVTFTFNIRRKPLFYLCWVMAPTLILSLLSVMVFYLPVDAGEKLGLSIFIVLSLTLPLMLCSKFISASGDYVPILLQYIFCSMILSSLSVLSTAIVVNVHYRAPDTNKMPDWVRRILIEKVPRFIGMERPATRAERNMRKLNRFLEMHGLSQPSVNAPQIHIMNNRDYVDSCIDTGSDSGMEEEQPGRQASDLDTAVQCVDYIVDHFRMSDEYSKVSEDWTFVAMVIDRLFLIFYSFSCLIAAAYSFMEPIIEHQN